MNSEKAASNEILYLSRAMELADKEGLLTEFVWSLFYCGQDGDIDFKDCVVHALHEWDIA